MSEYAPTTEDVRRCALEYWPPITGEEFDRWMAAHDAEVRAAVCTPTDDEIRAEYLRRYSHANIRDRYDADLMMAGFEDGARWAAGRAAALAEQGTEEWEYGYGTGPTYWSAASREEAEFFRASNEHVVMRHPAASPGPWLPVPADETEGDARDRL